MALFEQFPYTNFHEMNLDWLLQKMQELAASQKTLEEAMEDLEYTIHHLDVDDAVVETLNNMLADGTLADLMAEAIAEYEAQIGVIVAQQNQRIAVVESRVSELTNLPEGSTSGDAELADIRIDAWGDAWPTAGDAVRGQIGILSDTDAENKIWPTEGGAHTLNGLTWLWNGDGSLTIQGTATATTTIYLNGTTGAAVPNLAEGSYLVQRWIVQGSGNVRFGRYVNGSGTNLIATYDTYASASFTQGPQDGGVYLQVGNQQTVNGTYRFMVSADLGLDAPAYSPAVRHSALDAVARTQVSDLALKIDHGVKWRYVTISPAVQNASEGIEVLCGDKLLFLLVHSVDATVKMDTWRIAYAWKSDADFTRIQQLTIQGEWECAIKLSGWTDFAGGYLHGHEWMSSQSGFDNPHIISGGVSYPFYNINVSPPTYILPNYGDVYQASDMYMTVRTSLQAPSDTGSSVRARHNRIYHFTSDGLELHQSVNWNYSTAQTTGACYLAMLPVAKNRVDGYMTDAPGGYGFRPLDPNASGYTYSEPYATHAELAGPSGSIEFSVPKYPTGLTGGDKFQCTDNNGNSYAKMYYYVCDGASVSSSTPPWQSTTVYKYNPA